MVQVHGCTHVRTHRSLPERENSQILKLHNGLRPSLREKASSEDGKELSSALIG